MKKVINKGFTIEVVSWENDGDNYRTKTKTVESREEAAKIIQICKELFCSCNNGEGGIGNSMDNEGEETVLEYIEAHPEMNLSVDKINSLSSALMGGSEYYDYRVCESVSVTYSPEDIFLEEIKF